LWETQNGPSDVPPAGAYATIKNNNSGSVALVDASYSLAQLTVEENSGLYISDKGELLAQTFALQNNSWVIVPVGRIGAQSLTMGEGSVLDLIGGNGCILNADLKDLKVDSNNPKGILTVGESGSADVFKSFISAHKVEQQGNIKAHQATFNLQPVTTGNYTNVEFLHQKGKIYPREGAKPDFFFQVNGLYKLKPDAVIEMFIYGNEAAPVNLRNLRTTTPLTEGDKPSIEGKLLLAPDSSTLTNTVGIVLMDSDIPFTSTTQTNVSRLLHEASRTIAGKSLSLKMSGDNKQILLDIADAPKSLKATLWGTSPSHVRVGNSTTTEFFTTYSTLSTDETLSIAKVFGVKHTLDFTHGTLALTQTFNRAQLSDYVYRFIPESRSAFWMMQHSVKFNTPVNLGNITLTPSAGVSHLLVQHTAFQDGFQTLNPDLSLTCGITHVSDTSTLSMNAIATALYSKGTMTLSDHDWIINTGFNVCLQTPLFNIATGVLNPFQSSSEMYVNVQADF
jgi:hypothetical protein